MAWTWTTRMVDPIAYRAEEQGNISPNTDLKADWSYDPAKLKNPNDSLNMYWDDSSEENYKNPATIWGKADKYTWEWVRTSDVAYNPDITTKDLNPDYLYGREAQMYGSENNWYISERNDNIASALYNEGRVSKEDVANFLNQQKWFQNSTEEERINTIESVWKRLWKVAWNGNENENKTQWDNQMEDNSAQQNIEQDLLKDTSGKLYWKVSADENDIIRTLQDENSIDRAMKEQRVAKFKELQAVSSEAIAAGIVSWAMATDTQTMTDLMQYDPNKYQEVQRQVKALRGQMNINSITSWSWEWTTSATNWQSWLSNEKADFISNNASGSKASDLLKNVNDSLSSNVAANTASEQMANIESDMASLQSRMKNLKKEASQIFKWDVPQYIVNAYVANRTAEIQDQLSQLENRYNMAYSRYQQEWEQTKRNAEFWLKQEELNMKRQSFELDNYVKRQWVEMDWLKTMAAVSWTSQTITWWEVQTTTLSREEIWYTIDDLVQQCADGTLGKAQCAAWIQKYYLPYLWVDLGSLSAWSAKQWICNEKAWEYTPQKWDLVVMQGSKPEYWHIWIVIGVDEQTWTMKYLDWNWSVVNWEWTETAAIRNVPLSNSKVYGYYNPTKDNTSMNTGWVWTRNDGTQFDTSTSPIFSQLSPKWQEAVYQLLNNNLAKSSVTTRAWYEDPEWIFAAVWQINPLWSESDYNNRKAAEAAWAKLEQWWATSRNATAVSTAKRVYDLVDSLTDEDLKKTNIKTINALINTAAENLGNTKVVELRTLLNWLQSETAGALKWWNAAISDQDKKDMEAILNVNLSKDQLKTAMEAMVRLLYDKNETEAKAISNYGFYKKKPIWTDETAERMNNDLWLDLSVYYDYNPKGKWWDLDFLNKSQTQWVNYISQL